MKFMLLICGDEEAMTPKEGEDVLGAHVAFTRDAIARGAYVYCEALQPPAAARTVRVAGTRKRITDGPFAETREFIGGFYMLDCADADEAAGYAERVAAFTGCAIEVRPVNVIPGWEEAIGLAPSGVGKAR
jgi:hypothetical protein